jgi:hypothetical protein
MPTDYAQIREENIGRYGTETAHLALLGDLYSERTHFIFELLQNAEDAKATQVQFRLGAGSLELHHDGRLFTPDDVRGIASMCRSTNQGDPERIGRFGIGFKSAYAYTTRPEIHSGDEHFAIEHYVRPQPAAPRYAANGATTLIVLPFNSASINAADAQIEIKAALNKLDPINLLFLRRIQQVELLLDNQVLTVLQRKSIGQLGQHVRMVVLSSLDMSVPEERWLVFDRPVKLVTPSGLEVEMRVEAAFALTADSSDKKLRVVPRARATLAVFFPTDRPTATGFILQGPYIPTPARDNIRHNDPTNIHLAHESAELIVEALRWLRDRSELSAEVLTTLPLKRSEFPQGNLFRPMFERVLKAIKEETLLPAHALTPNTTSFIAGNQAKVAASIELRELLSTEQLRKIAGDGVEWQWLGDEVSVRGDSDLACYLRKEIGIKEINASELVSWLEKQDTKWWKSLDEQWLIRAYRYLQGQAAEHARLRKLTIVRLESGEHISPSGQAVFFSPDDSHEKEELAPFLLQLPIIRQSLLEEDKDKAVESFLRQMGVARLVATEFIRLVLIPRYSDPKGITADENRAHVRFVFKSFQRMLPQEKRELVSKLRDLKWLLCRKSSKGDTLFFVGPTQTYLPQAYTKNPSLEKFYSATPETWFLDSSYPREGEEWLGFLADLGCARHPRRIDEGHDLEGLTSAITRVPSLTDDDCLLYTTAIFDVLSAMVPEQAYGRENWASVESRVWVTRRGPGGGDWCYRHDEARFFSRLKRTAWMPDSSGKLYRPGELFEDNDQNNRLLGDAVPYLHKSITLDSEPRQWLAAEMGVHRRPTKEAVLGRLNGMKAQTTPLKQVTPVYEFLAQANADVADNFEREMLILCPDAEPLWRAPSQVFWDDESPVFGTTRGYLKKYYPTLREFFAKAGVPQSAGPLDYVEALVEIANAANTDFAKQTRIHRILKRLIPRLEEGGDWQKEEIWQTRWARLQTGRNWIARKGESFGFFGLSDIVRVDNEHIAELFQDSLSFWPFPDLNKFASEQLKLTPASSAQCRFKVESEQQVLLRLADGLQANWTIIAAFLHSEKWITGVHQGAEAALLKVPTVRLAQRIAVTYELKGACAEEPGGKDGFVDAQQATIWLTQKPDEDDLIEALGDALQEFFGPEVLREFVCDLFRKGPAKAVEKWKKKGLLLTQPPTADHPGEETVQEGSVVKEDEPRLSKDAPETTGVGSDREPIQSKPPGQAVVPEPSPAGPPTALPGAPANTALPPPSVGTSPLPGTPAANLQTQGSDQKEADSGRAALSQGTNEPTAPPRSGEKTQEENPPEPSPTTPAKSIKQALQDAFNKPGKTGISDDRPESGSVGNPKERRKRTRDNYAARKSREPAASLRVTRRVIDVWDPKNKVIRDFLYEEYSGRCQICGETNRFPRRDGRAYFEAVYLIPHTQAAWTDDPGSVICLCALCSAKFQHGAVKCENVEAQIHAQKAIAEGGHGKPVVTIELVGKQVSITFSERHLIEVQEMLGLAEGSGVFNTASEQVQHGLVKCPQCHDKAPLVRADRLPKHISKVHGPPHSVAEVRPSPQHRPGYRKCRHCDREAAPNSVLCYDCIARE